MTNSLRVPLTLRAKARKPPRNRGEVKRAVAASRFHLIEMALTAGVLGVADAVESAGKVR